MKRGRLAILTRLGVTLGAAWLVFYSIDWGVLAGLLARSDLKLLGMAVPLAALQFAVLVFRWQTIIKMLGGGSIAGAQLALGFGRSLVASQVLPSTVGADVIRSVAVARHIGRLSPRDPSSVIASRASSY